MSILFTSSVGWLISHELYVNVIYSTVNVQEGLRKFRINPNLFKIENQFRKKSNSSSKTNCNDNLTSDSKEVELMLSIFNKEINSTNLFMSQPLIAIRNTDASLTAEQIYKASEDVQLGNVFGKNSREDAIVVEYSNQSYLFPSKCEFFCKNISEIESVIGDKVYDLILLDPPWWNKYIRRKKSKNEKSAYTMIYNKDLKELPLENMLSDNGIIVVWCTNSDKHQITLLNEIFPKWNVKFHTKWYWLKVTCSGVPICSFSKPPGKQPYELLFIASKHSLEKIPSSKLIVSVPSALHSHKPPLTELFRDFLPNSPKCLEIFARYLLPEWTSWGLEVLRFQHNSLYTTVEK